MTDSSNILVYNDLYLIIRYMCLQVVVCLKNRLLRNQFLHHHS